MNWNPYIEAGTSFIEDSMKAESTRKWNKYANKMTNLQAARSQDALTTNRRDAVATHVENKILVDIARLQASSTIRVSAAAAGVAGGSVSQALHDTGRSAGKRLYAEEVRFSNELRGMQQQSETVAIQAQLAQKQMPAGPSVAGMLLNMGSIYTKDQLDPDTPSSNGLQGLML